MRRKIAYHMKQVEKRTKLAEKAGRRISDKYLALKDFKNDTHKYSSKILQNRLYGVFTMRTPEFVKPLGLMADWSIFAGGVLLGVLLSSGAWAWLLQK